MYVCIYLYILFINTINTILYHRPLPHSNQEHEEKYFLGYWKYNNELWGKITELAKPFFKNNNSCRYYPLIDSIFYNIENDDLKIAALVEMGNICGENGDLTCFDKAYKYLSEILSKIDPNRALTCIIKYLHTFCYIENDEYIPELFTCRESRGSIVILLKLLTEIKGGEKSKKKEIKKLVKSFCELLEMFNNDEYDSEDSL